MKKLLALLLILNVNQTRTIHFWIDLAKASVTGMVPAAVGAMYHYSKTENRTTAAQITTNAQASTSDQVDSATYDTFRPYIKGVVGGAIPPLARSLCGPELSRTSNWYGNNLKAWVAHQPVVTIYDIGLDRNSLAKDQATTQGFAASLAAWPIVVVQMLRLARK